MRMKSALIVLLAIILLYVGLPTHIPMLRNNVPYDMDLKEYPLNLTCNYTYMHIVFTITSIQEFSYIYIALDAMDKDAGYSYGLIIIYDPTYPRPQVYVMSGSGNTWRLVGEISSNETVYFSLLIDHPHKTIYYTYMNKTAIKNITGYVKPTALTIILDSISNEIPIPTIDIKQLVVGETNDSKIIKYMEQNNITYIMNMINIIINETSSGGRTTTSPTTTSQPSSTTSTTTTTETKPTSPTTSKTIAPTHISFYELILLILVAALVAIIIVISAIHRQIMRSPGP